MAKKKNSVALFEVIQTSTRSDAKMVVPQWMDGSDESRPASPEGAVEPPPVPAPAAARRLFAVAGDRLRLSLTYTHCAVAVLVLVGLLVGAFAVGWHSGTPAVKPPEDRRPLAQRTPLGRHVLKSPVPAPAPAPGGGQKKVTTPAAEASDRQRGKYYLVIQGIQGVSPADLDEASRIVEFCKAQGEKATVARYTSKRTRKQRYIVWSLRPFDSATSEEGRKLARSVEALGKQYFAKYTTYDFRQRGASGKFDPWFEVYR